MSSASDREPVPRRARTGVRRRPRSGRWAVAVVVVAAVAAMGVQAWRMVQARHVTLEFTTDAGPVPPIELTFFPAGLAFAQPSPPPALGRVALTSADAWVGADLVPGSAVVRYAAPGIGTGYRHVGLGEATARIRLRPPRPLVGRVVEPIAAWCVGWRCIDRRAVPGAEVIVMGGGEHGVVLASGRTDADGRFAIDGVDLALDGLGVRVRATGFAIAHRPIERGGALFEIPVARTEARRGRIDGLGAVDPATLRVLARGLPGVEAVPAADGTFVLDHVPADTQPRLLLHGLPGLLTHRPARAEVGEVHIEVLAGGVVRGRVVDAATGDRIADALVFCGDDEAVRTDGSGAFELARVLPGTRELRAQVERPTGRRRTVTRSGRLRVQVTPGSLLENVVVVVE